MKPLEVTGGLKNAGNRIMHPCTQLDNNDGWFSQWISSQVPRNRRATTNGTSVIGMT